MISLRKIVVVVTLIVLLFFVPILGGSVFENVDAEDIVVIQDMVDGDLNWFMSAGLKGQWFGKVTRYQKRSQFWFSAKEDQGKAQDDAIKIRFNDGGHAFVSGSISWSMPLSDEALTLIHTKYGSQGAVEQQLVRTVIEKAIYMTGPLMSSKQSYAEYRPLLLRYIEDQIQNGVYETNTREVKAPDPVTGEEKTVTIVEIAKDPMTGAPKRTEESSPLTTYGILTANLSINEVRYDETVEKQIKQQQDLTMQVQTAIAEAKKSEQSAITAAKNGEAEAAKAKWAQEVIKATEVTAGAQRLAVASLDRQAAEQIKLKAILIGEGEARAKQLVMAANGQLEQKLATLLRINEAWATAYATRNVPTTVFGGGSSSPGSDTDASAFMTILTAKAARDLSVDLSTK